MKAAAVVAVLVLTWAAASAPTAKAAAPARAAAQGDILAAGSFRRSAVAMTCSPPATRARAGRLVVLCRFADRLAPGDPKTNGLLADIYLAQSVPAAEATALEKCLAAHRDDYARGVRWVAARLASLQTAGKRAELLQSVAGRDDLPASVRAEASAMLAGVRRRQGLSAEAAAAAKRAVQLDAFAPSALAAQAAFAEPNTPARQIDLALRVLRGSPRAGQQAWQVAVQLGGLGVHKDAASFFDYAWLVDRMSRGTKAPAHGLVVQYCNALLDAGLDAGRHGRVIEIIEPLLAEFPRSADLRSLLLEAYGQAGQAAKAAKLTASMAAAYEQRRARGEKSAAFSAEMAWFYLATDPRANLALVHAQQAATDDPNNPVTQRVLGAAEIAVGRSEQGRKRLAKLLAADTYAAVFLAEHYYAAKDQAAGKRNVLAGAKHSRSGPAFRRLLRLARKHKVALPPAEGSAEAARAVGAFDRRVLAVLSEPAKYLRVAVQPVRARVACGEAVEVAATLTNVGPLDVPLGEAAVVRPVMALEVTVAGAGGRQVARVASVPMAVWPAPRVLAAGKSVRTTVRLDVAELAKVLDERPLEELSLTVGGVLDPQGGVGSALPGLQIAPVKIVRADLLGQFDRSKAEQWPQAYAVALGRIVGDLKRGKLAQRMRAARQIGSLLALAQKVQAGHTRPPAQLATAFKKPVLLSMMRAMLRDASPVVRQEMIASLGDVPLDAVMLSLLAPAITDKSPLVRCRLVELLAASRSPGHETVVQHLAGDKDELVAAMARAFLRR